MPRRKGIPSYRLHKARNCAVVTIDGKNHYLGRYESPGSYEKYARLIAEWKSTHFPGGKPATATGKTASVAINELILAFWQHARLRYVKNGEPTSEIRSFRTALRPVRQLYGREPVTSFGPLALVASQWEQDLIDSLPRFPKPRLQRDVAGRHYLTKAEINALYFATHEMKRPRGWNGAMPIGRYWRSALVVFFNYGVDTGTIWKSAPFHEPILWRHVSWGRQSPDREVKEQSSWGWLFYRRVKTGKTFYRPMNRVIHAHIKSIMPENPAPDDPVFLGGGSRPNARFQELCDLAGIKQKTDVETGQPEPWELKDLRKTCATYYDEHMPESSVEIFGHSVVGITYRHYAHRAPLAFKAIMTLPQPTAFSALARGYDGECPCCRRPFADAS
jgi:hypothetical protein